MGDLYVTKENSVNIKVDCERGLAKELSDYFTFNVPGHKYMPAYRKKKWDGKIKLYNIYSQEIYAGLLPYVEKFAKDRKYTIGFDDNIFSESKVLKKKDLRLWIDEELKVHASGNKITVHEHQLDAIQHAIAKDRCLLLSPTGSGKSLIIYSLVRYYQNIIKNDKKILIIVPTTSLVTQMYNDFKEYSEKNTWDVRDNCHKIYGGQEKECRQQVVISTWQSIYQLPQEYFENFHVVFGDECHLFKAKSLTKIMSKLQDCPYRIGTTGTLDGTLTHKLVIEGLFGSVYNVTSTKDLIDKDLLSKLKIDSILLSYGEKEKTEIKKATYQDEIDWIVGNKKRNEFITKLSMSLDGNTLVLFQFVEKHGKILHELIKEANPDKKVFFIYGQTDVEIREEVRHIAEETDDAIIIASYGTFSTGVSIKRLHNIIFASPSKSRVRVLQSIGRQLRKSVFKDCARLYDIGDDLSFGKYRNHTLRHFLERIKIYKSEGFNFSPKSIRI
tara:strand:- start:548 stop:2044 length:1497 start_codon:yes stop_codon:yes gene_type:complete